jgi:hypothetical protein
MAMTCVSIVILDPEIFVISPSYAFFRFKAMRAASRFSPKKNVYLCDSFERLLLRI